MRIADDELMDDRVIAERLREVGARRPRRGGRLSALSRSLFQQGVVGAFAESFGLLTPDFGVGKGQDQGF